MLDWNLKATWDGVYSSGLPPYMLPGYWRFYQFAHNNGARRKVEALISRLSLSASSRVAVIGGGFGYLQEELERRLPGIAMATTDTSTWVQSAKSQNETQDLRDAVTGIRLDPDAGDGQRIVNLIDLGQLRSQVTILNENIVSNSSRNQVRGEAGLANNQDFDWVISDDVLPTLTDTEAGDLDADMRQLGGIVVHIVTPLRSQTNTADFNWKTTSDWKILVGTSGVFDVGTFEAAA